MASVNARLQDEAIDHAIDLQRYSMGVVRRMIAALNRSDARLVAQLSEALLRLEATSFTVERLEETLSAVRATNSVAYRAVLSALESDLRSFGEYEAAYEVGVLRAAVPPAVLIQVPVQGVALEQVYAAAMSRPFQGRLLAGWLADLEASRATAIRNAVRAGFVEGRTVPEIVRAIRGSRTANYADGLLAKPRRELEAVVRTAISHTAQTARQLTYDANADLVKALKWVSTLDSRTSPMCFPESTLALPVGDLRGITRRKWDGYLVVVTTASGKKLRATPNHPVLTARGWRPIQEVEPRKDVLYRVGRDIGRVPAAEDVEVPATMGAIFDALREPSIGDVFTKGSTEVDFHGDGVRGDYEVNHPHSEGHLRRALDAAFGHEAAEELLVFIAGSPLLAELGEMDQLGSCPPLADVSTEVNARTVEDRVKAGFAHIEPTAYFGGLGPSTEGRDERLLVCSSNYVTTAKGVHDASALEDAGNGGGGNTKPTGNTGGRGSVSVVADDVVSVEREFFSGHVCNLSTGSELYIADSFVVHNCRIRDGLNYTATVPHKPVGGHKVPWGDGPGRLHFNCRSVSVPVLKSWRELGIDIDDMPPGTRASMDGQVPADTTYGQWLSRQSAARQDEILGPERGKLLRSGRVTFERFSDDRGQWLTLDELRAKLGL